VLLFFFFRSVGSLFSISCIHKLPNSHFIIFFFLYASIPPLLYLIHPCDLSALHTISLLLSISLFCFIRSSALHTMKSRYLLAVCEYYGPVLGPLREEALRYILLCGRARLVSASVWCEFVFGECAQ
jgi:hypothetical protein